MSSSLVLPLYALLLFSREARAQAPDAGALLELARARIPDLVEDLRYATAQNFIGRKVYEDGRCWLRAPVALRLARVARRLRASGHRLKVWDCYRPLRVQRAMWRLVADPRYVADPAV